MLLRCVMYSSTIMMQPAPMEEPMFINLYQFDGDERPLVMEQHVSYTTAQAVEEIAERSSFIDRYVGTLMLSPPDGSYGQVNLLPLLLKRLPHDEEKRYEIEGESHRVDELLSRARARARGAA